MTPKEKSLLLQDLCARLPYGVIVRVYDIEHGDFDSYVDSISNTCVETHPVEELTIDFNPYVFYKLQEIKPYLRPMSSITKEEYEEETILFGWNTGWEHYDWLNAHHFDYRGLIEKGLALEAPEGMYK